MKSPKMRHIKKGPQRSQFLRRLVPSWDPLGSSTKVNLYITFENSLLRVSVIPMNIFISKYLNPWCFLVLAKTVQSAKAIFPLELTLQHHQ